MSIGSFRGVRFEADTSQALSSSASRVRLTSANQRVSECPRIVTQSKQTNRLVPLTSEDGCTPSA